MLSELNDDLCFSHDCVARVIRTLNPSRPMTSCKIFGGSVSNSALYIEILFRKQTPYSVVEVLVYVLELSA